ncbi:hypothetical protein DSM104635_02850 [Terricaulis silvestris]|uniref:Uncharacterized protein n=1 Tax=Terricaulis silvestris TaxID=2686094 RepID=A0A6I6MU22_9CAUL|nr:hypothetical protein DSM104635_02850 [Terricaulis silvestris]
MSTLWVRRQLRRSQRREAWQLAAFALFGVAFGVAAFLSFDDAARDSLWTFAITPAR